MTSSAKLLRSPKPLIGNVGLIVLTKMGTIIRLTALSLLFAGSIAVVFVAVTLVKAGEAKGLTVAEAASANAPVFIEFSKLIAASCISLLIAEAIDSFSTRHFSRLKLIQYALSAFCCLCGFTFALVLAPMMNQLLDSINYDVHSYETFRALHQSSRFIFSGIILFAWLSLILPIFGSFIPDSKESK